jgi:hypothetical protein
MIVLLLVILSFILIVLPIHEHRSELLFVGFPKSFHAGAPSTLWLR